LFFLLLTYWQIIKNRRAFYAWGMAFEGYSGLIPRILRMIDFSRLANFVSGVYSTFLYEIGLCFAACKHVDD